MGLFKFDIYHVDRIYTFNHKKEKSMLIENIANTAAMFFSSIAMVTLIIAAYKIGGFIGSAVKFLSGGIFLSVFCHAGFELLAVFGMIDEEALFPVMGALLTAGSIAFVWAGFTVIKNID